VFLDDNFILGSWGPPALLVYKLKQRPADDTTHTSTHCLRFFLGTHLQPPQGTSYILLASDPSPGWSPNAEQVPFHIAGDERMIAMYSTFFNGWWGSTYLIPAKVLLREIESLPLEEGLDVALEAHSPQLIEHVPEHKSWDESWPYVVFGMRHVLPEVVHIDGKPSILIRDLSPRRCLRASNEEREDSHAVYEATAAWYSGRTGKPNPCSILTCVPLPENIHLNWNMRFLICEDGIVVLENVRENCVFIAARLIRLACRTPPARAPESFIFSRSDSLKLGDNKRDCDYVADVLYSTLFS
jgi:hypothetical protein